jgi:tRNA threonylcarbamoyl adenosine modification protein YeaZ
MRVLAIDTALEACSAAVLDTSAGTVAARESLPMQRGHAEALMPLIARVMGRAGCTFEDLDRIAVTTGPGSFTGLRVGIAAARGLALATGKPAVGITTLAAFAAPFIAADDLLPVVAAIDARHDHVPAGFRTGRPDHCGALHHAATRSPARVTTGAPRITGTAAAALALWPAGEHPPNTVDQRAAPASTGSRDLSAAATDTGTPPKPLYLRATDAHPQDAVQLARR